MILYLTYNEAPGGVYWSQVTDVVAYLNTLGGARVRLVALVSLRDYAAIRRKIKAHAPGALVLPMVPGVKRWRANGALVNLVCRLLRPTAIMARGVLATWMALRARDKGLVGKVGFDARAAYAAEWEEYRIINDDALIAQFRNLEAEALERADMRLAVSQALVQHWRERYGYAGNRHVVIPCTLGKAHLPQPSTGVSARPLPATGPQDVLLAYAGSSAGWQSFELLSGLLRTALHEHPGLQVLFLSQADRGIDALAQEFPGRVARRWLSAQDVPNALRGCDAALLVREDSITNRVASPTKFAEYLACGLPVIISEGIGDFSAAVLQDRLGTVCRPGTALPPLHRPSDAERDRLRNYAMERFTKEAFRASYLELLLYLA